MILYNSDLEVQLRDMLIGNNRKRNDTCSWFDHPFLMEGFIKGWI